MSVASLNVQIRSTISPLEKELKRAERTLQQFGRNMTNIGNSLSLGISLPLAGIGIAAIKAAGDLESLKLAMRATFEGAGRSIQEADAEINALRKSALAPGLDFEQAVKASIRLQAVGSSAEGARKTIEQLANAIATTGGTAANLESVTVQMSQMISKGKVLAQDLRIIQENMPVISRLMKQAFGTSNAEDLQKLGISGKDFVERITAEMEKLPRVQGGIANAIVNAWSATKNALATLGETINKTFNVTGRLDQFATWVQGLAEGFSQMSDGAKSAILGIAAFALVLGPAIRLVGLLGTSIMAVRNAYLSFQIAMKVIQGAGIIEWWRTLNAVMRANIIGATIAVVIAAAAAFALLSKDMSATAQAARAVDKVSQQAANSIIVEKYNAEQLVAVLKDENTTRKEKEKALATLKSINPQYFGALDLEKGKVEGLDAALQGYVESIKRAAMAQAAYDQIVELSKQKNNLAETAQPTLLQEAGNAFLALGNSAGFAAFQAKTYAKNATAQTAAIDAQIKALTGVITANSSLTDQIKRNAGLPPAKPPIDPDAAAAAAKRAKALTEILSDWHNDIELGESLVQSYTEAMRKLADIGFGPATKEAKALREEFEKLRTLSSGANGAVTAPLATLPTPGSVTSQAGGPALPDGSSIDMATAGLQRYMTVAEQLGLVNVELQRGFISLGEAYKQTAEIIAQSGTVMQQVAFAGAAAMAQYAEEGGTSFAELGKAALAGAAKVVRAWIMQGVAAAAAKALQALPFPFNIAAGIAAGAAAGVLFNKLIAGIGLPLLASGGVASGPTLAMVGEYAGAASNPEVIAPLSKLRDMIGNGGSGRLVAVVKGKDIHFIMEAADRDIKRTRGYGFNGG